MSNHAYMAAVSPRYRLFIDYLRIFVMKRTHLRVWGVDYRESGQTEYEYTHQAACGYVRNDVTRNIDKVDCKLCLKSGEMKHCKLFHNPCNLINITQLPDINRVPAREVAVMPDP